MAAFAEQHFTCFWHVYALSGKSDSCVDSILGWRIVALFEKIVSFVHDAARRQGSLCCCLVRQVPPPGAIGLVELVEPSIFCARASSPGQRNFLQTALARARYALHARR
eukprot:5216575-Pleurochrysis_carterae.AAC.1